ncbi:hypothetical protein TWF281_000790 [Arthrobotrys megalospora]
MPPSGAPSVTSKSGTKKMKKSQVQDDDGTANIRWTKALELALASRMVDEYNSKYIANKAATSKKWAGDIGILDADPRGKKTKHHITKMVLDWKKTWDWSQGTGRGDVEKDGVITSLEQQCIDKCHYFKALFPVFGSSSSVQPSAQLTSTGAISTASVGASQVGKGSQKQAAETEVDSSADSSSEDEDDREDQEDERDAPEWRDSDDEDQETPKAGDDEENRDNLNIPKKAQSKPPPVRQPSPLSRAGSATPRQFAAASAATPSKLLLNIRHGKKMSAIDEMRAMIQAPVEAQKAKYEAKVAIAKSELDKEKAQKEHEIKMARLSILQKEQDRSHEIAILNAKAEIEHYSAEIERLKLKRSMGLDLTDEEKEFICKPAPKMPTIAAPKSILDDPDLIIISSRPAPKRSEVVTVLKQERDPERKSSKRKLAPDATPTTTIDLESTRTPTTTQRGQINDLTPTVKRPSKKPKPSADVPEKPSLPDPDATPTQSSTPAPSDGCTSPAIEPVLARIQRASINPAKNSDKTSEKTGDKTNEKTSTKATKSSRTHVEHQSISQPHTASMPKTSQPPAPGPQDLYDYYGYPDAEFYRNRHAEGDLYNEGYQRMLQGVPHGWNDPALEYAPGKPMPAYGDYEPAGPSQMSRFYGDDQLSAEDQALRHQRALDARNMFFSGPHPARFGGPRPHAPHPRHHPHAAYPSMYPAYPPLPPHLLGEGSQAPVPVGRADYRSTSPDTVITAASETGANPTPEETADA